MKENTKDRSDVLQFLINELGYKKYLEVGVQYMENWDRITCDHKQGVEPNKISNPNIYHGTSDQFFAQNMEMYDLVFIDGDHNYAQVIKDFYNALRYLNEGGAIVFHDALPHTIEYTHELKCGTVYKALLEIRSNHFFDFVTFEENHGVCVVRPHKKDIAIECRNISWEKFWKERFAILNVGDWDYFKAYIKK